MSSKKKKRGRPERSEKDGSIRLYESTLIKWNELKKHSNCKSHNEFAMFLLDLYTRHFVEKVDVAENSHEAASSNETEKNLEFDSSKNLPQESCSVEKMDIIENSSKVVLSHETKESPELNSSQDFPQESHEVFHNSSNVDASHNILTGQSERNQSYGKASNYFRKIVQSSPFVKSKTLVAKALFDESDITLEETMTADETQTADEILLNESSIVQSSSKKNITLEKSFHGSRGILDRSISINPSFCMIEGDPFEEESEIESSSESSSSDDTSSSDTSYDSDEINFEIGFSEEQVEMLRKKLDNIEVDQSDNFIDSTFIELGSKMELEGELSSLNPEIHASVEGNVLEIKEKLKEKFETICSNVPNVDSKDSIDNERFIISLKKLIELKGSICTVKSVDGYCFKKLNFNWETKGSALILCWSCENQHFGKWESAEVLCVKHNNNVYALDLILASSILFSGNNYGKIQLLFEFCNVSIFNQPAYNIIQKLYCTPAINELWEEMKAKTIETFKPYNELCLCGDGRNDSPGHSAKYGVYVMMEHFSTIIVDVEVVDKRETKGVSTNMEREGLRRLLMRLKDSIEISEVTTDASTSVQKLVTDMKDQFKELENLFHSFDVWHKSKNLSKKLHKLAAVKGNEILKPWVPSITNHFWHCAASCDGSPEMIKNKWLGVVHHICGEHNWVQGSCDHGELSKNDPKDYLSKSASSTDAVKEIVLDQTFMKSLPYYVRNRHTGHLENFNGMLTKYTPKRNAFEYQYFIGRTKLAAIDHNVHAFRSFAITKDGRTMYHRKYSKRSKTFSSHPIKTPKTYPHVKWLMAKVLSNRIEDDESVLRRVPLSENHPKMLSPTLAIGVTPPSTSELVRDRLTRKR